MVNRLICLSGLGSFGATVADDDLMGDDAVRIYAQHMRERRPHKKMPQGTCSVFFDSILVTNTVHIWYDGDVARHGTKPGLWSRMPATVDKL